MKIYFIHRHQTLAQGAHYHSTCFRLLKVSIFQRKILAGKGGWNKASHKNLLCDCERPCFDQLNAHTAAYNHPLRLTNFGEGMETDKFSVLLSISTVGLSCKPKFSSCFVFCWKHFNLIENEGSYIVKFPFVTKTFVSKAYKLQDQSFKSLFSYVTLVYFEVNISK